VTLRRCVAALAALVLVSGCGAKTPDYQSIWSSSSTATTKPSAAPEPIAFYLEKAGVNAVPMTPATLTDLSVSIPHPPGWSEVTDPNQPAAFQILRKAADAAPYPPTALLMVFKLIGNFDVAEAIRHGYADAELSNGFARLNASMDNFQGFPSAMIEGSYNLNNQRVHAWNRIVIATAPQTTNLHYLVQLTVTTAANQAQTQGADVESIIAGFKVAAR
jgi:hypothetical protein